jgi:hypothetical protein
MVAELVTAATAYEVSPRLYALPVSRPSEAYGAESILGTDALREWLRRELSQLDRALLPDEREAIDTLRDIWQSGYVQRTWGDLRFVVDKPQARHLLDLCAGNAIIGLVLEGEGGTIDLFGRSIALGREQLLFFQARMANQGSVRALAGGVISDDAPISLHFVPGVNYAAEGKYFDLPRLLAPSERNKSEEMGELTNHRPGEWHLYPSQPLRSPVELAPSIEKRPSGWRLEVSDRVRAKFHQLDCDERAAVLALLWGAQRRGGRDFLAQRAARVGDGAASKYVLSPTPDLRLIFRPLAENTLLLTEFRDR